MATINAVIPLELLAQLRQAAQPDESVPETVQGAIQATFPTSEVSYSEASAEVTVEMPDDEIISALLGMAVYEQDGAPLASAAVKPETLEAKDARGGISSDVSPLIR